MTEPLLNGEPCDCGCGATVGSGQPGLTLQEVRLSIRTILSAPDRILAYPGKDARFYHAYSATENDAAAAKLLKTKRDVVADWRKRFALPPRGMTAGSAEGMFNTGRMAATRPGFPDGTVYKCARCGIEVVGMFKSRDHSKTCPNRAVSACHYCTKPMLPGEKLSNTGKSHRECAKMIRTPNDPRVGAA